MGCDGSLYARTVVQFGIEQRDSDGCLQERTANFEKLNWYDTPNPLQMRTDTIPHTRSKGDNDPDPVGIGASTNAVTGRTICYGSGIANLPPEWMRLLRTCGFRETRTSRLDPTAAGTFAGADGADDGEMVSGDYDYAYTMYLKADKATVAQVVTDAAFETRLGSDTTGAVTVDSADDLTGSVDISNLPAVGIKRLYRTKVGGTGTYYLVAEIADGTTTYHDTLHDKNLGMKAPVSLDEATATPAAAGSGSGSLPDAAYTYKYTSLYDTDGAVVTDSDLCIYESDESALFASATTSSAAQIDITGLPSAGVKRLYRLVSGTYRFVAEVAAGETTYTDTALDATLATRDALVTPKPMEAIYTPVSALLDYDAATWLVHLDSRKGKVTGARGTATIGGDAGGEMPADWEFGGTYNDSVREANPAGPARPGSFPQICGADLTLTPASDPTDIRLPEFKNVSLSLGRPSNARRSGNAPCANSGVKEYGNWGIPDTRLSLTWEVEKEDPLGVPDTNWQKEFRQQEFYAFQYHLGSTTGKYVYFENYLPWGEKYYAAQIVEAPQYGEGDDELRTWTAPFLLTGENNRFLRIRHSEF